MGSTAFYLKMLLHSQHHHGKCGIYGVNVVSILVWRWVNGGECEQTGWTIRCRTSVRLFNRYRAMEINHQLFIKIIRVRKDHVYIYMYCDQVDGLWSWWLMASQSGSVLLSRRKKRSRASEWSGNCPCRCPTRSSIPSHAIFFYRFESDNPSSFFLWILSQLIYPGLTWGNLANLAAFSGGF